MKLYKIIALFFGVAAIALLIYVLNNGGAPEVASFLHPQTLAVSVSNTTLQAVSNATNHVKVKTRYAEFTDEEKAQFYINFANKYKPTLSNWCKAYGDHVPFPPDAVTPDKLVERVGINSSYREYIFVLDGTTLGIQDAAGIARVDYLNNPVQTRKMAMMPDGTAPIIASPVQRADLIAMLATESGIVFPPDQVKLVPSGVSGGLNGGVLIHVGGTPDDAASWKFDYVFGPDGKIAFYLKGH